MKKQMKFTLSFFSSLFILAISTSTFAATNSDQNVIGTIERIYLSGDTYFFD